ncbi:MCE family protein [Rhodococcus opacus]|uniref:MCE family protein n=1 Tax=Rhodococcus opacus TaxID=37919 RepID=UPI000EA86138|nr:MCE family protein [Rhodococcus opacus]QZS52617.1 MCE family protein [Rhodococcus opacus]RKM64841.1 mammalian cell entry protein [Rhodococcus opacus]
MATKSFLERNPIRIGVVGTIVLVGALALALNFDTLPGVAAKSYHAEFGDASGLAVGDTTQIAGVKVGEVREISLHGDKVDVEFDADSGDVRLGDDTRAAIKVETALGRRYVELTPGGDGEMGGGDTIPLARTTSGYDVTRSLEEVTDKVSKTDTVDLSGALDQLSKVEQALPPNLQSSLTGLSRLSETVASRDADLRHLLTNTAGVSAVLSERSQRVAELLGQGQTLFDALNQRADSIHHILVQARQIADELTALKRDNADTLGPTLAQMDTLVTTLTNNYDNINASLTGLERYSQQIGDVVGSGPFFGVLLHNILPANLAGQLPGSLGGPR